MKVTYVYILLLGGFLLWGCSPEEGLNACIDDSKICDSCMCSYQYMPVCGCDGQTYGNECMASMEGVSAFTEGKCP